MARRSMVSLLVLGMVVALLAPPSLASAQPDPGPIPKLRGDLADLVAGRAGLDPRIPSLVAGYRAGEIPYFAILSTDNNAARRTALDALGARVLRSYRSVDAFALASDPTTVLRVAAQPWVTWLAPIEVVVALEEPVVDQARSHTAAVGATEWWDEGITGSGVRIAVLDTGVDPVHPDLDDLDFGGWSNPVNPPKVVDARDFNGGVCRPLVADGHGHGTHVAGIATGTGEGTPLADDNGRYAGIAPGAELAVGKVLTDAGAGINSDLVAAMEWAAMPADPLDCAIGADIVNLSLGSESRPTRLNSGADVDFVSLVLNRLAVEYGTLFVVAAGNSGPYIGSVLESPGSAAQALSVGAAAKDWDVNHDDTASGDTCAGWRHPPSTTNDCSAGTGDQPPSVSAFSSRGPSGDVWLRPDLVAPGYNIVSAQSTTGIPVAQNDLSRNTRGDPLYATATGTSMASPATAGSAALLLQAYRDRYGTDPAGASGLSGMDAPAYALLRAALMNSAGGDLFESRWILTTDAGTQFDCPDPDPLFGLCAIVELFTDLASGSLTLYEARNQGSDPYPGPLAEGAGKLNVGRAIAALRDGIVVYSAASGAGSAAGTGHRDLQGSWQIGPVSAGASVSQQFIIHAAPQAEPVEVSFAMEAGNPSDGSRAIDPAAWEVSLPSTTSLAGGEDGTVAFSLTVPAAADAGNYTAVVRATTSAGQTLRIPVFASVALHDPDPSTGNAPGPQAKLESQRDVYAKADTVWPSLAGAAGGSGADWLVYPVELAADLSELRASVYDADRGDETYDLYLYDAALDLVASTHPFAAPGVTDVAADDARAPSTALAPQELVVRTPAGGRHYLAVSRSRAGGNSAGDFGRFVLTLDEVRLQTAPQAVDLSYDGDYILIAGAPARLAARLTDADGQPIAGRLLAFTLDGAAPCPSGSCTAVTDYDGLAQLATDPIAMPVGVYDVAVTFAGDGHWQPGDAAALVVVVGSSLPPIEGGETSVTAGGWFLPTDAESTKPEQRIHLALQAKASGALIPPSGHLGYRDSAAGIDVRLVAYATFVVADNTATLTGLARHADGRTASFELTLTDAGEPGRDRDTVRFKLVGASSVPAYEREGTLGGGNVQLHP